MKKLLTMITTAAFLGAMTITSFASTGAGTNIGIERSASEISPGLSRQNTAAESVSGQDNETPSSELGNGASMDDTASDTI